MEAPGSPDLTSFLTIQFSSQSETPDRKEQLQQALEERAQLETQVEQVRLCRGGCGRTALGNQAWGWERLGPAPADFCTRPCS